MTKAALKQLLTTEEELEFVPAGTSHKAEFYGRTLYYKRITGERINSLIDHPVHQWQDTIRWYCWDLGEWAPVGSGFSDRMLRRV